MAYTRTSISIPSHLLIAFMLPFLLYAYCAAPTVALEDDGFFILNAYFSSVNHPPGYPLFSMIGKLFTYLPIGSVAYRVHLVSALFGALTCLMLWYIVYHLLNSAILAYIASLSLATSSTFWSQAVIAEVYTLNTFIFFSLFALGMAISNSSNHQSIQRLLLLFSFLYGLGLANHWPLLVMATPGLIILLWPHRLMFFKSLHYQLICLSLGLTPYIWMVYRSQAQPAANFMGPILTASSFLDYVSRKDFAGTDNNMLATYKDKINLIAFAIRETVAQFSYIGTVLILLGFHQQHKETNQRYYYAALASIISTFTILFWKINFNYDALYTAAFKVYPLVTYGLLTLWLAMGIQAALKYAKIAIVLLLLPLGLFATNIKQNDRSDYDWSERYSKTVLHSLPANAIAIVDGDIDMGTLAYFHLIENFRPDITLYTYNGLVLGNRLYSPRSSISERATIINRLVRTTDRPIITTKKIPGLNARLVDNGLYFHVQPTNHQPSAKIKFSEEFWDFFEKELPTIPYHKDAWSQFHQELITERFGQLVGLHLYTSEHSKYMPYADRLQASYFGSLGLVNGILLRNRADNSVYQNELIPLLKRLIETAPNDLTKPYKSRPHTALGIIYTRIGEKQLALESLKRSVAEFPHQDNQAVKLLGNIIGDKLK